MPELNEQELTQKYVNLCASIGDRLYRACLPAIESLDTALKMLEANRQVSELRQKKQQEEVKPNV